MKVVTPEQMNMIDSEAINKIGIPSIVLMENAALKVVEEVLKGFDSICGKRIIVIAGKGNNGGDAFAAARHLYNKGALVKVFLTSQKSDIKNDPAINLKIIEKMKIETVELTDSSQIFDLEMELEGCDLILDGIFGTGFKGQVKGLIDEIIDAINNSGKLTIAIDIPSGINGENGKIEGKCIKADKTVTFVLPKIGLSVYPGCDYTGELAVSDIGIPDFIIKSLNIKTNIICKEEVSSIIPVRSSQSSKGDYGRVFIVSGSTGMIGSGCLCANAALRSGAGLVYLGVPASLAGIYQSHLLEPITFPLEDHTKGYLADESCGEILKKMQNMKVLAIGPGLSTNENIKEIMINIFENSSIPLVLDADALNAVSEDISMLKKIKVPCVITPHPGEMSRLLGISIKDIQNDRIKLAMKFADKYNVITVLKGMRTIIALPDGNIHINPTGNPGMATAGTGDVLTGIIAGFIGQGMEPEKAAIAGVYIHGLAGDMTAEKMGQHGLIAGDLVKELPYAIKKLQIV
ncbi:MAG: NAD(P)H-hydrate dehydratase [Bacillota bacterium]|nr:NAD(P)H-hydrate dehydratase [Bacillota bacterium]